jgi:hypothetical protein
MAHEGVPLVMIQRQLGHANLGITKDALAALHPDRWELIVADDRPRPMAGSGVDAVIRARRRS